MQQLEIAVCREGIGRREEGRGRRKAGAMAAQNQKKGDLARVHLRCRFLFLAKSQSSAWMETRKDETYCTYNVDDEEQRQRREG